MAGSPEFSNPQLEIIKTATVTIQTATDSIAGLVTDLATTKTNTTNIKTDTTTLKADTVTLKADTVTLKADTVTLKADTAILKADTVLLKSKAGVGSTYGSTSTTQTTDFANVIVNLTGKYELSQILAVATAGNLAIQIDGATNRLLMYVPLGQHINLRGLGFESATTLKVTSDIATTIQCRYRLLP